jgi:hypothetical protein
MGITAMALSVYWMITARGFDPYNYVIPDIIFIMGVIFAGYSYAKCPDKPKINSDRANKNLQTFNDTLWGKEKEKDPEEIITITVKRRKP